MIGYHHIFNKYSCRQPCPKGDLVTCVGNSILCSKCKEIPVKRPVSAQSKQNRTNDTGMVNLYIVNQYNFKKCYIINMILRLCRMWWWFKKWTSPLCFG